MTVTGQRLGAQPLSRFTNPDDTLTERWRRQAVCRFYDPELFFVDTKHADDVNAAKAICWNCPVRGDCLAWAVATGQDHGIWGGQTPTERKRVKDGAP